MVILTWSNWFGVPNITAPNTAVFTGIEVCIFSSIEMTADHQVVTPKSLLTHLDVSAVIWRSPQNCHSGEPHAHQDCHLLNMILS